MPQQGVLPVATAMSASSSVCAKTQRERASFLVYNTYGVPPSLDHNALAACPPCAMKCAVVERWRRRHLSWFQACNKVVVSFEKRVDRGDDLPANASKDFVFAFVLLQSLIPSALQGNKALVEVSPLRVRPDCAPGSEIQGLFENSIASPAQRRAVLRRTGLAFLWSPSKEANELRRTLEVLDSANVGDDHPGDGGAYERQRSQNLPFAAGDDDLVDLSIDLCEIAAQQRQLCEQLSLSKDQGMDAAWIFDTNSTSCQLLQFRQIRLTWASADARRLQLGELSPRNVARRWEQLSKMQGIQCIEIFENLDIFREQLIANGNELVFASRRFRDKLIAMTYQAAKLLRRLRGRRNAASLLGGVGDLRTEADLIIQGICQSLCIYFVTFAAMHGGRLLDVDAVHDDIVILKILFKRTMIMPRDLKEHVDRCPIRRQHPHEALEALPRIFEGKRGTQIKATVFAQQRRRHDASDVLRFPDINTDIEITHSTTHHKEGYRAVQAVWTHWLIIDKGWLPQILIKPTAPATQLQRMLHRANIVSEFSAMMPAKQCYYPIQLSGYHRLCSNATTTAHNSKGDTMRNDAAIRSIAQRLRALGDPLHLRILQELSDHGMYNSMITAPEAIDIKTMTKVSELAVQMRIPQSTLSNHLRILRDAGLLSTLRRGGSMYYFIDSDALRVCMQSIDAYTTASMWAS